MKFIDRKIRQAFSNAALQYEALTSLHKEIGRELVGRVRNMDGIKTVLDVGMGTGWLTRKLAYSFPDSKVVGLDFAPGMIEAAKKQNEGFQIIQADACQLPFQSNAFDLIVSNLAYQWVHNQSLAFGQAYSILKPGGRIFLTMFGHETLSELFLSLENSLEEKDGKTALPIPIHRLATRTQMRRVLVHAGFTELELDYEHIRVHFPDMMSLIQWTKEIGANRLEKEIFVGKGLFLRAGQYYDQNFRDRFGIYGTFEVIWIGAKK